MFQIVWFVGHSFFVNKVYVGVFSVCSAILTIPTQGFKIRGWVQTKWLLGYINQHARVVALLYLMTAYVSGN